MKTAQLEFPEVESPTPEQRVAEIIRLARARYGKNLKPFYEELLKQQPKPQEDPYAELVAIARQKRQRE
jgi:hypothetical protein